MAEEKKVVIKVSDWLRVYDDGSVDRTWTGPPEFSFLLQPVPSHEEFIESVATRDVIIDKTSGHRVRIYLPERKPGDTDKLPVILHFHGGGFCLGKADWYMYYYIYSKVARASNAIVVSVYLRQAPEHRLPAQIDDGYDALLWLRSVARAESYEPWLNEHADLNRIFLIGDSSGGNIVHEVAARAGHDADLGHEFKLSGGILIQPGFVRETRSKSELEQPQSAFFNVDMADKLFSLSLPVGSNKDHPITCPMGSLAPPLDGLKLPPMLVSFVEFEVFLDTEMEYYEAMKKANQDVQLLTIPGVGHAFYLMADMDPRTAVPIDTLVSGIVEFVKKH